MSTDSLHTLQRSEGGDPATLRVTVESVSLTFPPPTTPHEKEAMDGLTQLAEALKRPAQRDENSLSIKTDGHDVALGAVVANVLAAHEVVSPEAAAKVRGELDKDVPAPEHIPPVQENVPAHLAAAANIGKQMNHHMVADASSYQSLPAKEISPPQKGLA